MLKFSSVKNKIKICRITRPDTAKLLAFLKSAAKNTPSTIYSFMTSKISQTSVIGMQKLLLFYEFFYNCRPLSMACGKYDTSIGRTDKVRGWLALVKLKV